MQLHNSKPLTLNRVGNHLKENLGQIRLPFRASRAVQNTSLHNLWAPQTFHSSPFPINDASTPNRRSCDKEAIPAASHRPAAERTDGSDAIAALNVPRSARAAARQARVTDAPPQPLTSF